MALISNKVKVKIRESSEREGVKALIAEIEAEEELFLMSDMLAKKGAIAKLSPALRTAIREVVTTYIKSGDAFIESATAGGKE